MGRPAVMTQLIAQTPTHGRIVFAGASMQELTFNPLVPTLQELEMIFCLAYTPSEFDRAALVLREHPEVFAPLITGRRPLAETSQAFADLSHEPTELKILICPQDIDA